jgi:hypothetical protein
MTFEEARALFPVLERIAYLNAGTFGPLARPTADAIADQFERDLERGRSGKLYIDEMLAARSACASASPSYSLRRPSTSRSPTRRRTAATSSCPASG